MGQAGRGETPLQATSAKGRSTVDSPWEWVIGIVPFDEVKFLEQLEDFVHGEMARKVLKEKGGITNEVFAPRWTSLRASGGVIYFGGKPS